MMTSRSEYRLLHRQDNADERLSGIGRRIGLVDDALWESFQRRREAVASAEAFLETERPDAEELGEGFAEEGAALGGRTFAELLRRPEMELERLASLSPRLAGALPEDGFTRQTVQSNVKYKGYMERQQAMVARSLKLEETPLPEGLDYGQVAGLSAEVVEKLRRIRPASLGQAGRISGVTPAAVDCLEIHLHKLGLLRLRRPKSASPAR